MQIDLWPVLAEPPHPARIASSVPPPSRPAPPRGPGEHIGLQHAAPPLAYGQSALVHRPLMPRPLERRPYAPIGAPP
ncbi:hypothetical protein [Streptomyces deccanensis]|uniref:hypothetical protein n=1 Tax=Streptomyces deccanensis TaxID=424188 RepID=UPI001EFA7080|nr:hypothetical protein [Streptomyces deccanensis]ULR51770.1 hypothetical protein L3078_22120 [Streptomyces deccanensis]